MFPDLSSRDTHLQGRFIADSSKNEKLRLHHVRLVVKVRIENANNDNLLPQIQTIRFPGKALLHAQLGAVFLYLLVGLLIC
jgi:hypothetical protein